MSKIFLGRDKEKIPPDALWCLGLVNRAGMPCLKTEDGEYHILSFGGIASISEWCREMQEVGGGIVPNEFLD